MRKIPRRPGEIFPNGQDGAYASRYGYDGADHAIAT
jgi:hypothetical protein